MILKVHNLVKSIGKRKVLRGISFELKNGELIGITGENGSGKSTLLKIIVGQWKANAGSVVISGKFGYCPQELMLFRNLTVEENFKYFSYAYGMEEGEATHNSNYLMERLRFKDYHDALVSELSGGTQQKLNLSIALLHKPDLLILDEPYNGFDWDTYQKFWSYADELKEEGCGLLVVSHLISEVSRFDNIMSIEKGSLK